MASDDDHFRVRPGRVRDRAGGRAVRAVRPRPKTFFAEVHKPSGAPGATPIGWVRPGRGAAGSMRAAEAPQPLLA
jgi:hypothetical protein